MEHELHLAFYSEKRGWPLAVTWRPKGGIMFWYRIGSWNNELIEMEVIRQTERFLIVQEGRRGRERRIAKISSWDKWFPKKEEAISYRRTSLETQINNRETSLGNAKGELEEFNQKYPKED